MSTPAADEKYFSFIVPIYDDVDSLAVTLESIAAVVSELPIEIIIVDDGGPDTNAARVEAMLQGKKVDVQYLRKANEGPYHARKYGFSHASGTYIVFVDCGDAIFPDVFGQLLVNLLTTHDIDILVSDIISRRAGVSERRNILPKAHQDLVNAMPALDFFKQCNKNLLGTPGKLYSRRTLAAAFADIDLPPRVCNAEDLMLFTTALGHARDVHYVNSYFYIYELHDTSLSHDQRSGPMLRRFRDKVCVADSALKALKAKPGDTRTALDSQLQRFFRKYKSSVLLHWVLKFPADFAFMQKVKIIFYYVITGVFFSTLSWKVSKKQYDYE